MKNIGSPNSSSIILKIFAANYKSARGIELFQDAPKITRPLYQYLTISANLPLKAWPNTLLAGQSANTSPMDKTYIGLMEQ